MTRDYLIALAAAFFRETRNEGYSLSDRVAFLRSKGLTDEEIRDACSLAMGAAEEKTIN